MLAENRPVFGPHVPQEVYIESNAVERHAEVFERFRGKRAVIVTGRSGAARSGALADVEAALDRFGVEHSVFAEVEPNPSVETCQRCIAAHQGVDLVVACGGGSAMDAAKAIAIGLAGIDFLSPPGEGDPNYRGLPLVSVCTASGTASEVTQYAIITDRASGVKKGIPRFLFSIASLVDPKYQLTVPRGQTLSMCVDVMCHATESMLTARFSPELTEPNCLQALRRMGALYTDICAVVSLPAEAAGAEPQGPLRNPAFRAKLAFAAAHGGGALAHSSTSIPHGMSYPLTVKHRTPHGIACGLFLPGYIAFCSRIGAFSERLQRMAQAFSEGLTECGASSPAENTAEAPLAQISGFVSMMVRASGYARILTDAEAREFSEATLASGKCSAHPFPVTLADLVAMCPTAHVDAESRE